MKHRWAEAIPPILNQQLKVLRRLGYGTEDLPFDDEPPIERPLPEPVRPLLAPGEREEDVWL